MAKDKLLHVPVEKITIGERFRKDYGDMSDIEGSIAEKGIFQPVTLRPEADGMFKLMAGGRRMACAIKLELKTVPALIREADDIDLREIELIENVFRKDFNWQEKVALIAELYKLMQEKHGKEWSVRKTAQLLGHSNPMTVSRAMQIQEAMEIPELAEEIGKLKTADEAHKLIKRFEESLINNELVKRQTLIKDKGMQDMLRMAMADYRIGDAVKGMEDITTPIATFIEVDPPYGIDLGDQKKQDNSINIVKSYNEIPRVEYQAFTEIIAEQTFSIAKDGCWMVYWYGPTHHQMIFTALTKAGWLVDEIPAIWTKGSGQTNAPEVHLARSYEPFFVCRKGRPILSKRGRSNVFDFSPVAGAKKYHPTERPMALMEELLATFTIEGSRSTVVVPFAGSGVTFRACYLRGLRCYGWDLNPEYKNRFLLAVQEDTEALSKKE